ncbi:MAG: hypothetical protein H0V18_05935 [Pyrinomonadaceae bacterium]|nr:hypothetical protein [Pyrinomonadaceae bacterium]
MQWIKSHWRSVAGGAFLLLEGLSSLWKFVKWLLGWSGAVDLVIERSQDPKWTGSVMNFLLAPPPILTLPLILIGLSLIWWDYRRHKAEKDFAPWAKGVNRLIRHPASAVVLALVLGLWVALTESWIALGAVAAFAVGISLLSARVPRPSLPQVQAKELVENNPQAHQDMRRLIDLATLHSTISMFDGLIKLAPATEITNGPLQKGAAFLEENGAALQFVDVIRDRMDPGSERRSNFERVMNQASLTAEQDLEHTPVSHRPEGIDHLLLRKWMIAHYQCIQALGFLQRQKAKAQEELLYSRPDLLKRWNQMHDPRAQA